MPLQLIQIPGVENRHQTIWEVRVLQVDGRDLVLPELVKWSRSAPADYKKIMKVLQMIGQVDRIRDEKKVKKSRNRKHDGVYEIRADKGSARLMFFYCKSSRTAVVCTNTYWKTKSSKGEQDNAFELCARLKEIYEQHK
jgi:putative component of toxin-antitoxin plasmid stabilization module